MAKLRGKRQYPKITNQSKAAKKYRNKIKRDPKKYEEYKAKDRERKKLAKAEGRIKSAKELGSREKRIKRRKMREYMKAYRQKKKNEKADDLDGIECKCENCNY